MSDTNSFAASPLLQPGQSYSFRFGTPSFYSYHDGRDPSKTGTVKTISR